MMSNKKEIIRIYTEEPVSALAAQTTANLRVSAGGVQIAGITSIKIGTRGELVADGIIEATITCMVRLGDK